MKQVSFQQTHVWNFELQARVGSLTNGVEFLLQCGFKKDDTDENLVLAREDVDIGLLNVAGGELNKAITNPFFGVLK